MRAKVVAVLAGGALALLPATASADSIVYIKDGNVWLANPDGSGHYQVTLDGTPTDPYESPSQADDGSIVATRGSGEHERIYRMRQNGSLLGAPFEPAVQFELGLFDAAVSPDGSMVAYWTGWFGNSSCEPGSRAPRPASAPTSARRPPPRTSAVSRAYQTHPGSARRGS
jgi:hypothetical protein